MLVAGGQHVTLPVPTGTGQQVLVLAVGGQHVPVPVLVLATGQQVAVLVTVLALAAGQQVPVLVVGRQQMTVLEATGQQVTVPVLATGQPPTPLFRVLCSAEVLSPSAPDALGIANTKSKAVTVPASPTRTSRLLFAFIDWPPSDWGAVLAVRGKTAWRCRGPERRALAQRYNVPWEQPVTPTGGKR